MRAIVYVLLTFIAVFGISCTQHSDHKESQEKNITKYICPMHPQISSDKPGQCSICGMNLVPFEEDNHEGHDHESNEKKDDKSVDNQSPTGRSAIKLSLDKEQLIGVTTVVVKKMNLFKTVRAPGRIAFDPELYTAQSEYLEAVRQWKKVKNSPLKAVKKSTSEMIRSSEVRLQVMGLTQEQIKRLAKKGRVSDSLIVGDETGENLIYADVYEADLSNIKQGQLVSVEGSFLEGKRLKGEVVSVDQVIDPKTRTGKVRIKIEKTKASIRPEAFVNVSISVPLGSNLAIPLESVLDTGRDLFVFVKLGEGRYEPRKITKLFETDESMAVLSGLKENEVVVSSGNFMLDSESRLNSVIKNVGKSQEHNH